ncbi:MAG: thioredoxin [Clostridium sp.]|uniref:thioredoxin n=1 Tax=Clostridium culturomicium TaxID=1499683 RepID=UPI00058EC37F|nr:thioredoxin [Clostridium culturomicium]MDU4890826.1 thioredoxin [Clostridium sp.]MDU7082212.1 thioredoxin [Clostridium sp.]
MKVINEDNFEKATDTGLVLVDFYATWCGPCQRLSPVLEDLQEDFDGKAKFYKLDIDESRALARKFSVMSVPTMIILKDGHPVDRMIGYMPPEDIKNKLAKHL